ncbi:MAG: cytochrome c oxidase subunit 3 [Pseudomonadales bacterium]|nr:cytochrome c oxidase subunit 3 [Pseudomonadales bacterium]
MSMYKQVTNKPWETQGLLGGLDPRPSFAMPSEKLALFFFMAVVCVLFSLFTVTYYLRMELGDWIPVNKPGLLWLNTGLLVLSSVFFQFSRAASKAGSLARTRTLFLVGGMLALAFIAGQVMAWQQLSTQGYFLASNPANAFFYLMTGLHIAHLLGGLWVWSRAVLAMLRTEDIPQQALRIELCTLYWHFLLLIWIALFAMLANT